jgi:hypothetical protein
MKPTPITSSAARKPAIVQVPANGRKSSLSLKDAEVILRREGFRPLSEEASRKTRKFFNAAKD